MNGLLITSLVLFACALVFAQVIGAWREAIRKEDQATKGELGDQPLVSVIVPARDEAGNIAVLLQDLYGQRYPQERMEVIVVDDGSTDTTAGIVEGMMRSWPQLRLLKSDGTGKKSAITTGVVAAKGELVVLTDADVRCGLDRIISIAAHWRSVQSDLVILPVYTDGHGALGRLQEEEQAALLGMAMGSATRGRPSLAYGANLAFRREAFLAVGGYEGDRFASGDDLFLLQRMQRAGKRITCLFDREALVTASAVHSAGAFVAQRLRWAGKMGGAGFTTAAPGLAALLFPWVLLWHSLRHDLAAGIGDHLLYSTALLIMAWSCWFVPIIAMVGDVRRQAGRPTNIPATVLSLIVFSCYAPLIALGSLIVRPKWKGRNL
ncbi:MAG: glycosyltransferase [Flavobacteriales bacterium]|nr:glycosyltransferase [Flavobacteriales bacterium]